jgi:glycosyltransferase involved in cell wall biosynthesis
MRIAFIMSRRDPSLQFIDNDGGVILLMGYGQALVKHGHTVDVYTARVNDGWGLKDYVRRKRLYQNEDSVMLSGGIKLIRKEVRPIRVKNIDDFNSDFHAIESSCVFAESFSDELKNYDIVSFFHPTSAYGLLEQNKVIKDKTVLFPMLLSTEYSKFKEITQDYTDMEAFVLKEVGSIFSSSQSEVNELASLSVDMNKIEILARGYDTNVFQYKLRTHVDHSRPMQIISVGAIKHQKRQDVLIDIAIELHKRNIQAQINIVGDNINFSYEKNHRYYLEMVNKVSKLGLGRRVIFQGGKTPEELAELLNKSDLAVFPSIAESFGKAALETIACGVPTIASKNVEAYSIFMKNGFNSVMVEPSIDNYVNVIERLYGNPHLYQSLSEAGRAMKDRFSWDSVSTELEELYLKRVRDHKRKDIIYEKI